MSERETTAIDGPIGSLALSVVRAKDDALVLRAIGWHRGLEQLGVILPFSVVHDVGLCFAVPREQYELGPRVDPTKLGEAGAWVTDYASLVTEITECEAARRAPALRMSDDLIVATLARVLGYVAKNITARPAYASDVPLDAAVVMGLEPRLSSLYRAVDRAFEHGTVRALIGARLLLLTMIDSLDLDTLRLFGLLGSSAAGGALAQVDLLAVFDAPEANDIVDFSLEILPSVLETKAKPSAGLVAAHGYSGLSTRGSMDSMVLTELAWDDLEMARRLMDNEVLYYAREQSHDEQKRLHWMLIDASASMRGDRQTFARGMAIATGKKLLLEGEQVAFRFFDSRLYEARRASQDKLPTAHVLSFKGERGRNPTRVFSELVTELELCVQRDHLSPVVHLFTHAALYIPRELVQAASHIAPIAGVFILPSGGKLDLDYLDLLSAYWVVDHDTLGRHDDRASTARAILDGSHDASTAEASPAQTQGADA